MTGVTSRAGTAYSSEVLILIFIYNSRY